MNEVLIAIGAVIVFFAGYMIGASEERKRVKRCMKRENLYFTERKGP